MAPRPLPAQGLSRPGRVTGGHVSADSSTDERTTPLAAARPRHLERLDSREQTLARMRELAATTTTQIRSMVRDGHRHGAMRDSQECYPELRGTSVRRRSLYARSVLSDPGTMSFLHQLHRAGELIRVVPVVATRLEIFDQRAAIVAVNPDEPGAGALVLTTPSLVESLAVAFDLLWKGSQPLFDGGSADHLDGPSAAELELIRMLAAGHTDESAARTLGVSSRTVRRMIADLSRRAGTTGRFQLGAMAERLGWIDLD